jgi:hypothetical protein
MLSVYRDRVVLSDVVRRARAFAISNSWELRMPDYQDLVESLAGHPRRAVAVS